MPNLSNKKKCTGCAACANVCPQNAIEMRMDNGGFLRPYILETCILCKKCESVCPEMHKKDQSQEIKEYWIAQSLAQDILEYTASGGVFTVIARNVIAEGGVVAGAVYDNDFKVIHVIRDDESGIKSIAGSKYTQSEVGDIYSKIKRILSDGRKVCFSGTPCQVAGLKYFLGKEYENLITVDFICHSVPSPRIYQLYINDMQNRFGKIEKIQFKSKHYGYSFPTVEIRTRKNGLEKTYYRSSQEDIFMRLFLSGRISRDCCYNCSYRTAHESDITLADQYSVGIDKEKKLNERAGLNRIIVWSEKGSAMIENIKSQLNYYETDTCFSIRLDDSCKKFASQIDFNDIDLLGEQTFCKQYFTEKFRYKLVGRLRLFLYLTGLHDIVKKIIQRVS